MNLSQIAPGDTDRACFIGQTGSGKTTLARWLLVTRKFVIALHPKGYPKDRWSGYRYFTRLDALTEADAKKHPRLLYAPHYDELSDPDTMEEFFRWVYERCNCTLYIDELYAVTRMDQHPYSLGACYTRGRERRIETWGATQRPARVPQIVFTEAEHIYCFKLRGPADRERVEAMTSLARDRIAALPKHKFLYAPQDGDVSEKPFHLNLGKKIA